MPTMRQKTGGSWPLRGITPVNPVDPKVKGRSWHGADGDRTPGLTRTGVTGTKAELLKSIEPPCTDPYARWCGRGGAGPRGLASPYPDRCHIVAIKARKKLLALEESSLADWLYGALRDYVDELIVCDPRHNALISQSSHKDDREDAYKLCRLLRLGELKPVYHSDQGHRAVFKDSAQLYLDLRNQQVGQKNRIKAKYHKAGVLRLDGARVFDAKHREYYLNELPDDARRAMLSHLYAELDAMQAAQQAARRDLIRLGAKYSEITEFVKIPGIGPIGAHVFDAFIQTPHRFATRQKLWKYCKLAVADRSSAGKPLAYKRLDKAGVGELKALSHRAFHAALRFSGSNEVSRFYEDSLGMCQNKRRRHARQAQHAAQDPDRDVDYLAQGCSLQPRPFLSIDPNRSGGVPSGVSATPKQPPPADQGSRDMLQPSASSKPGSSQ